MFHVIAIRNPTCYSINMPKKKNIYIYSNINSIRTPL